ncbi:BQ5605_C003g02424 [Microbotryum silenes-dioicae]|uniref:BQ5605_C003g02424 protein n=1 Tax=Microbotryum silenes-dioicae TaxID=796604 RepID=A0A2X0M549_9BASI|nr:BQ5605_C003g02424 [Microbotryum silenes-dioicae]
MNMTIAELLAFDVAPADASLHIELSKDELTHYSTLSATRGHFGLSSRVFGSTQPTHLKLPPQVVDARDTNFSLNWPT